eukprot:1194750-Prorocentrum_minimum.AAC.2
MTSIANSLSFVNNHKGVPTRDEAEGAPYRARQHFVAPHAPPGGGSALAKARPGRMAPLAPSARQMRAAAPSGGPL